MPSPIVLGTMQTGAGRPVVLVHGFPFDAEQWSEQLKPLGQARRVIAVDLRGRGRSTHAPNEDWTLDTHADDLARIVREHGTKALVPTMVPKLVAPSSPAWVGQKLAVMIERTPPATCIRDLMAMRDRPDSDPASVRVPTLVLHGVLDALMPVAAARAMAAAIPGARFLEVSGSGHIACLENAPFVNQALASFLEQQGGKA